MENYQKIALILAILEKMLLEGPEVIIAIAGAWGKETPTPAEIRALKITKKPGDFFTS